jgi:predicted Ser/Thr protein kinase
VGQIDVGTEVSGYRVIGVLGEGGMGSVFLAEEPAGGERVALKVMPEELAADDAFRRRFLRESGYARSVDHPNVVRVRDAWEFNGELCIAMDYVQGPNLATLLRTEGALEPERAVSLLAQVGEALDSVHAVGVIHRDVKPGNVLIASVAGEERAFVTDFGLSKAPGRDSLALTAAGDYVGTFPYTAPEQILGTGLDGRADQYSLACVLFECLAGEPPFGSEPAADVLTAHVDEPPPGLSERRRDLAPSLDAVVSRALAKDPAHRFASCGDFMAAAGEALVASPPALAPVAGGAPEEDEGPRLRLKVKAGNATGMEIVVSDEFLIGRGVQGPGRLEGDMEISREHARISNAGTVYMVEDLGSTNGTFLNGRQVEKPEALGVGDEIQVGGTTLIVQVSAPSAPPPFADTPAAGSAVSDPGVPEAAEGAPPTETAEPPAEPAAAPEPEPAAAPEPEPAAAPEAEPAAAPEPEPPGGADAEPVRADELEPAAARAPAEAAPAPRVSLRIELDLEAGEARLQLEEGSDTVRLVYEDGAWRIRPGE